MLLPVEVFVVRGWRSEHSRDHEQRLTEEGCDSPALGLRLEDLVLHVPGVQNIQHGEGDTDFSVLQFSLSVPSLPHIEGWNRSAVVLGDPQNLAVCSHVDEFPLQ